MPEDVPLHLRLHHSTASLQSIEINDIMAQSTRAPLSRNQSKVSCTLRKVAMSANSMLHLMVMRGIRVSEIMGAVRRAYGSEHRE